MASAGLRLLGQVAVQFWIVLHLYNLFSSSVNACNRSSAKSSRLQNQRVNRALTFWSNQTEIEHNGTDKRLSLEQFTCQKSIYKIAAMLQGRGTPPGSTSMKGMNYYSKHRVYTHTTHLASFCPPVIAYIPARPPELLWPSATAQSIYVMGN